VLCVRAALTASGTGDERDLAVEVVLWHCISANEPFHRHTTHRRYRTTISQSSVWFVHVCLLAL
jgi:hypothetical protein